MFKINLTILGFKMYIDVQIQSILCFKMYLDVQVQSDHFRV